MQFLIKLWSFFDGKKTVIGSAFMMLAIFLSEVIVGIWGVEALWIAPAIKTLNWMGMLLGGTGMAHKLFKKPE